VVRGLVRRARPGLVPRDRLIQGHLKLVFFDGASTTPVPLGPLAAKGQRALDVREADKLDEAQLAGWVKQT
jgi:hypothetical protein